MRRFARCVCVLLLAALAVGAVRLARDLPPDRQRYVQQKYAGWNGVLRAWVCADWKCDGSFIRWLNACAATFEKQHEGVYVEFTPVSREAMRTLRTSGIRPPELLLFSPGVLSSAADLALLDASGKVDRSVQAAALAFGGGAEITTESGYLPFKSSAGLEKIHEDNLNLLDPDSGFYNFGHRGSSTDMGDVSMIMPALHAYTGGTGGTPHARDFVVTDPDQAYLRPAKLLAMNAVELLYGNAESAYAVLKTEPELTREDYKKLYRESNQTKHWNYMK